MSDSYYSHGESHSDRLARKAKDAPFMVAGEYSIALLVLRGTNFLALECM